MTNEQFVYWLQGFSEIVNRVPTEQEWKIIQDHLALVFKKVTPSYPVVPPWEKVPPVKLPEPHFPNDRWAMPIITC